MAAALEDYFLSVRKGPHLLARRSDLGGCDLREDESISVEPVRVLWVEGHEFVEENMSNGGHAHGRTRVAGVGLESGIDLETQTSMLAGTLFIFYSVI